MKLSTIIRQARNGELKGLSDIDKTDSVIVDYINMALVVLYSRFMLSTEEAIVHLRAGKTVYKFDGTDNDVLIKDSAGNDVPVPYGDVLAITEAFDEKGKIPINDDNCEFGIFTISYDAIQVPVTASDSFISIIYKKAPVEIEFEEDVTDPEAVSVRLPRGLQEALLHYIGYRAHGSLNGDINAENNTHLMRFEKACKLALDQGVVPMDNPTRNVSSKGFL